MFGLVMSNFSVVALVLGLVTSREIRAIGVFDLVTSTWAWLRLWITLNSPDLNLNCIGMVTFVDNIGIWLLECL